MTTLERGGRSALVVIDVQNDVVARAHRRDQVVGTIARLVERARESDTPVVWVQHDDGELERGSDGWRIVPELVVGEREPVVHKNHGDSFEATDLDRVLADAGVTRLIVTGAQTDWCVRSTLHGAVARGYDAVLVSDAHTTSDAEWDGVEIPASSIIAHTNMYWHWHRVPGRSGGTVEASDVAF
jgi:nicotinamidase-related amidase